jgi:uncharacterized protein (TIGR02246 family)
MALPTLDRQEVDRFARAFEELFDRGDAATIAAFYTEDAEVMAPDSDMVRGRDAIEAFFGAASAAARRTGMRRTIQVRQVERSGNLGYLLSTVVLEFPPAGGRATARFNDVTVWRRDAEHGWRIVVDSANQEPARQQLARAASSEPRH